MFIFTRIIIKLGAAPFHRWFLSLSKTLSLLILMLISTVQKIIPIIILRLLNVINNIIIFVLFILMLISTVQKIIPIIIFWTVEI